MANAIIAFAETVRSNRQLPTKVSGVLANLLCTRLDGDELFICYKDLQAEKMDLGGNVESLAVEKDRLAKVVADLEARLKESMSRLEESELRATKERETSRELEEELILYKKEVVEQHEKGFQKAVRQTDFLVKDLDLDIFDPFKDVKDGVQLDEEDIVVVEEEAADEGQGAAEHGDDTCD